VSHHRHHANTSAATETVTTDRLHALNNRNISGSAADSKNNNEEVSNNVSNGSSPTREETYAIRRNQSNNNNNRRNMNSSESNSKEGLLEVMERKRRDNNNVAYVRSLDENEKIDALMWNKTDGSYPPVMIGQYTAKHRHDIDKQEVLSQVTELDLLDMLPIVAACEFSLCIYYARAILTRIFSLMATDILQQSSKLFNEKNSSPLKMNFQSLTCEEKNNNSYRELFDNKFSSFSNKFDLIIPLSNDDDELLQQQPRNNKTANLGLKLCSNLLLDISTQSLIDYFKITFKQHSVMNFQPDRLFPFVSNGNASGDPIDKIPLCFPFASYSKIRFHSILAKYELQLFPNSVCTLAGDESSMQALSTLLSVLNILVHYSQAKTIDANDLSNRSRSSRISSGFAELENQVLRGVGVELEKKSFSERFVASSIKFLELVLEDALQCLEKASTMDGNHDWIAIGLDRDEGIECFSHSQFFLYETASEQRNHMKKSLPAVLWAYWVLYNVLTISCGFNQSNLSETENPYINVFSEEQNQSKNNFSNKDLHIKNNEAVAAFHSPETFARLIDVLASSNSSISLKYFAYDLSALILAKINKSLFEQQQRKNIKIKQNDVNIFNNFAYDDVDEDAAVKPIIAAAEFYKILCKEKKSLKLLGLRLKCSNKSFEVNKVHSRFTRSIMSFLLQCRYLENNLNFKKKNFVRNYFLMDLDYMYRLAKNFSTTAISNDSDLKNVSDKNNNTNNNNDHNNALEKEKLQYLIVTHKAANELTVEWLLHEKRIKHDNTVVFFDLFITSVNQCEFETPILVLENIVENRGSFRIEDLKIGFYFYLFIYFLFFFSFFFNIFYFLSIFLPLLLFIFFNIILQYEYF
jgi:hypothetical protein